MAPPFEQIENDVRFWRDFVLDDLDRIVAMKIGGNFAAAAVFAISCEVLGKLRFYGQPNQEAAALAECLPNQWKPVASDLYDALRNGLAHNYTATALQIDGQMLGLTIAWRSGRHLALDENRAALILAVPDLAEALRKSFDDFEAQLRQSGQARDAFLLAARQMRQQRVNVGGTRAIRWTALLATVPALPSPSTARRTSSRFRLRPFLPSFLKNRLR